MAKAVQLVDKNNNKCYPAPYWPIGSIYISVTNVNPSKFFGGTWVAFGAGRCLVGVDTSQSDFNTVMKTGGTKTHTHTQSSTGSTTLNINHIPSHGHVINWNTFYNGYSFLNAEFAGQGGAWVGDNQFAIAGARKMPGTTGPYALNTSNFMALPSIGNVGGGQGHSHTNPNTNSSSSLQPYITVYMWRRTA